VRVRLTTSYDSLDRPIETVDMLGRRTTTVWYPASQVQAQVAADGTRTTTV
jgi:YD repeat-containing protein